MSEQIESRNFQRRWHGYTLFAICALAFCVSLGTAMVSIAKALVLVGVVGQIAMDGRKISGLNLRSAPRVYWAVLLAVSWMMVTMRHEFLGMPSQRGGHDPAEHGLKH